MSSAAGRGADRRRGASSAATTRSVPARRFSDYMLHVDIDEPGRPREQRFEINHHAYRLRQSLCFIKGGITCISCHDPHQPLKKDPAPRTNVITVCLGCHTARTRDSNDCVRCHMPSRRDAGRGARGDDRSQDPAPPAAGICRRRSPSTSRRSIDVEFLDRAEVPEGALGQVYRAVTVLRAMPRNEAATSYLTKHLDATPSIVPRLDLIAAQLQQRHFQIGARSDRSRRRSAPRCRRSAASRLARHRGSRRRMTAEGMADLRAAMEADPRSRSISSISPRSCIAPDGMPRRCRR